MGRPKPHITYTTDRDYQVGNVEEWFQWMEQSLTFIGQVRAIRAVMQYPGGKGLVRSPAFTRWASKNVDHFIPPISPELAKEIGD